MQLAEKLEIRLLGISCLHLVKIEKEIEEINAENYFQK